MSDVAVVCEGLSKRYLLGEERDALDSLYDTVRLGLRRRPRIAREELWALRDLDLSVAQGESVGIIGRNGAGKSTLLKILARITAPTAGRAHVRGRVGALLEVGTAFDSELTGRENILINGALLGLSRRDLRARFDDIVEFAGVEAFIDTPVKRYSSGMYLRLGFAIAAHVEPEILVVDEVLAVGDAEFQRRCLDRMGQLGREGRTILYVSHDLGSVAHLSDRCVWLDHGRVQADGAPGDVVGAYLREGATSMELLLDRQTGPVRVDSMVLRNTDGDRLTTVQRGEAFRIEMEVIVREQLHRADVALWLLNSVGQRLLDEALLDNPGHVGQLDRPGGYTVSFDVPGLLAPGSHVLGVWFGDDDQGTAMESELMRFEVFPLATDPPDARTRARAVSPRGRWSVTPRAPGT